MHKFKMWTHICFSYGFRGEQSFFGDMQDAEGGKMKNIPSLKI